MQSIGRYLVNKRYTLEMEQRETLKNLKKESEMNEQDHNLQDEFTGGTDEKDGTSAFLGRVRRSLSSWCLKLYIYNLFKLFDEIQMNSLFNFSDT